MARDRTKTEFEDPAPYFPIVYIRGFAATMKEIESTVATPYMGFNLGSTKVRTDYEGKPVRFIFESPLLRLMKDEGYTDTYADGDLLSEDRQVHNRSIWIFRYYEKVSEDLGDGNRLSIVDFATDLRRFILKIRAHICGKDRQAKKNFRVYLVAHSMGGLIARCYLQNICVHGTKKKALDRQLDLPGDHHVDKVFTYGTPHNGIELGGFNVPNLGSLDSIDIGNFNRDRMWNYLALGKSKTSNRSKKRGNKAVNDLNSSFPSERFFCMVGTNYRDYHAFYDLSRQATGAMSDGLVMTKNAWVKDAPRAYVHRSHSGEYGIVNSEEAYQNLRRFLFGDIAVSAELLINNVVLPKDLMEKLKTRKARALFRIESGVCVRGAPYFLHERRVEHHSEVIRKNEDIKSKKTLDRVFLFSGFLDSDCRVEEVRDRALSFAMDVTVRMPQIEVDRRFWFDAHYEVNSLLREQIFFDVRKQSSSELSSVKYFFNGEDRSDARDLEPKKASEDQIVYAIPIGRGEGTRENKQDASYIEGTILITAKLWNNQ